MFFTHSSETRDRLIISENYENEKLRKIWKFLSEDSFFIEEKNVRWEISTLFRHFDFIIL